MAEVPGAQAALAGHVAETITPTSTVVACLQALLKQPVPNEPNTAAQGSKRVVPGVWLGAYGYWHGIVKPSAQAQWTTFTGTEELWRHLSEGGPPEDVALDYATGAPIVNKSGKAVPVTLCDAQHFVVLPHLWIGLLSDNLLAQAQASALLDWAVAWAQEKCPAEVNPRALGWMLEASAQVARANLALGVKDDRPLLVAKAVVARLKATHGAQNGVPFLVLNFNADPDDSGDGSGQADHGWCRASYWMHARIVHGLALWLDMAPWWGSLPLTWWWSVRSLYLHGLTCLRYGMETAEAHGALPGGAVDDYDPTPPGQFYVHKDGAGNSKWDGTMLAFAAPGLLSAERHAPLQWAQFFRDRVQAYYLRANRYVFDAAKPAAMDQHSASVALLLAGQFGWREA